MNTATPTQRRSTRSFDNNYEKIQQILKPEATTSDGSLLLGADGKIVLAETGKQVLLDGRAYARNDPQDEGVVRFFYSLLQECAEDPALRKKLHLHETPVLPLRNTHLIIMKNARQALELRLTKIPRNSGHSEFRFRAQLRPDWVLMPSYNLSESAPCQVENSRRLAYAHLDLVDLYRARA
jgi:hypothetical protein